MQPEIKEAIQEFLKTLKISQHVRKLIPKARSDLFDGPYRQDETLELGDIPYPGFSGAIDEIRSGLDMIGSIYVNTEDGTWSESEPRGYMEDGEWVGPDYGDIRLVEPPLIRQQLLGVELSQYVR